MERMSTSKILESLAIFVGRMYTKDARGIDADVCELGPGDKEFSVVVTADETIPDSRIKTDKKFIWNWAHNHIPVDQDKRIDVDVIPVMTNVVDVRVRISNLDLNEQKDSNLG